MIYSKLMVNLDSLEEIKKIDKQNVLGSISELPNQIKHAWEDANKVSIPEDYKNISNVVMCGMGGSGLGARLIESLYSDSLNKPLVRVNGYNIPAFCDSSSLVFCSSYSGTTEETVNNVRQAIDKKCKWLAIGTGGTLLEFAKKNNVPYYKINPIHNPSNQPRMAIGYSVIGQLVLSFKTGLLVIEKSEVEKAYQSMIYTQKNVNVEVLSKENEAKKLSAKLHNKIILFISGEHLYGAVHTLNNQLNENSKNLSFDFQIPELNHHLMEGLKYPTSNKKNVSVMFINSDLYSSKIKKRLSITKEVIKKNNISYSEYMIKAKDKLSQVFEYIQFGAYVNFYLAMLYGQDPAPIPWVDYFKNKLDE
jgi:glucose/mannose-6-phosphate isomerase